MNHAEAIERVRHLVTDTFASLGVDQPDQFRESILMHASHYCGRRFEAEGAHAVWFVEENQIKFVAGDGRTQVLAADGQTPQRARRAA
jgi:hypothetical protein